jgi:hypothetical protein
MLAQNLFEKCSRRREEADSRVGFRATDPPPHVVGYEHRGFQTGSHCFPFGIYDRETETETKVFAVLDLRRDPNWIRKELAWRGA